MIDSPLQRIIKMGRQSLDISSSDPAPVGRGVLHELLEIAQALLESDQDVSPCGMCSRPVLCIPDGLPYCAACAEKEAKR